MSTAGAPGQHDFHIGQRVSYENHLCTVRYIGSVAGANGDWLGVEWDDPTRGKHDGRHNGTRYFTCLSRSATAASFVKATRPAQRSRSFLQALKDKYAPEDVNADADRPIRISGKEVEEVGFAKVEAQLRGLSKLNIVLLDGLRIAAPWLNVALQTRADLEIATHTASITELDLSRNLFEDFEEIIGICRCIPRLRSLKLNGNRFNRLTIDTDSAREAFANVDNLELEQTLLTSEQVRLISSCFPRLASLNISDNQYFTFETLPSASNITITTLDISANGFTAISDFAVLAQINTLQTLIVNHGVLRRVSNTPEEPCFHPILRRLELAFNAIDDWSFLNRLSTVFPGLHSLRISHNPLYQSLQTVDGRPISHENGFLLTIARVAGLKVLNHSQILDKDRLEADTYYLAQIGKELQGGLLDKRDVVLKHPRYPELCKSYGRPDEEAATGNKDPNSLAASLLHVTIQHIDPASITSSSLSLQIPKRFSLYSTIGFIAQQLGRTGNDIELYWLAEQLTGSGAMAHDLPSEPWHSDEEDLEGPASCMREIQLFPSTKSIGNVVDTDHVTMRVVMVG